jgi:hypothetical protein
MQETNQNNTETLTPTTKFIVAIKLQLVFTIALLFNVNFTTTMVLP